MSSSGTLVRTYPCVLYAGICEESVMPFDVFGMCNALYDIQAEVPDEILDDLGIEKGSMTLVDEERQRAIVARVYTHIVNTESGGSGANTMLGVALLGGRACFTS